MSFVVVFLMTFFPRLALPRIEASWGCHNIEGLFVITYKAYIFSVQDTDMISMNCATDLAIQSGAES